MPLTSNIGRVFPSEALVTLNDQPRKAMADQITTASKERLIGQLGKLASADVGKVEQALKVQLGLISAIS